MAEAADAADRAGIPVYLARGVKPETIEELSQRLALDNWLAGPDADQADADQALKRYVTGG